MKKLVFFLFVFCFILCPNSLYSQQSDIYVVLTTIDDTDPYYPAVQTLSTYRSAQVIHFSPNSINDLLPTLINLAPRYAAIVLKPIELDINFVRRFLMMSTNLDDDPFSDFSYGYITGATAQDAINFVNNIIYAETIGTILNYPLYIGGYAASSLNFVYTSPGDYMQYLEPSGYSYINMETNDNGSGHDFFVTNSNYMQANKILDIGHNGDPHMLWLFEGGNSNPNPPVWVFDSTKIEDTAYARTGLTSYDIGAQNLYPAVAYNGACHSGEPKKVMVESDIMATFGNTQGLVKFYTMNDSFSFALQILKTGITGYFAPCGANNANDQSEDVYNTFLYDEPLGDIHKRSNDAVVMGFLGNRPNLRIYQWNSSSYADDIYPSGNFDPNDWSGASGMLGGKANRIYFGDPLYNPFHLNHSDSLKIAKATIDSINENTLDIVMTYKKPDAATAYFPAWDKFHFSDTRIYLPVELPAYCGDVSDFAVIDSSGPYHMVIHAVEHFCGKTILHIEVDIPDDMYDAINYNITFRIHYTPTGIDNAVSSLLSYFTIAPNPANNNTTIKLGITRKTPMDLSIFDLSGKKILCLFSGIKDKGNYQFALSGAAVLNPGIYFVRLDCGEIRSIKKLIVAH